jgi:uncharacterized delta-60 repeat protein
MRRQNIDLQGYLLEALEPRRLYNAVQLDPTFGKGGIVTGPLGSYNGNAERVVAEANGDLLIAGDDASGVTILRCKVNGTLDTSFGSGGIEAIPQSSYVEGLAVEPDGSALILFGDQNSDTSSINLLRLSASGQPDSSFNVGQTVSTPLQPYDKHGIAIQSDGKIIVSGYTDSGATLVRYNADGSIDSAFGAGGMVTTMALGQFGAVSVGSDGKIYAFGDDDVSGSSSIVGVTCFDSSGNSVNSFGTNGVSTVNISLGNDGAADSLAIVVQADNKLLGLVDAFSGNNSHTRLIRFNANGTVDSSFSGGVVKTVFAYSGGNDDIALESDGKIVMAGSISDNEIGNFYTARYDSNGAIDSSFGKSGLVTTNVDSAAGAHAQPNDVAIESEGKIVTIGQANGFLGPLVILRYDGSTNQAASALAFTTEPKNSVAGNRLPAITVSAINSSGSLVSSNSSKISLRILGGPAGAKLFGTTTVTARNGKTVFSNLSIYKAGRYVLQANSASFAAAQSTSFTIAPAAPSKILFSQPPHNVAHSALFNVRVEVLDQFGNLATNYAADVAISLGTYPKGSTLSGTLSRILTDGSADFMGLSLAVPGSYSITADSKKLGTSSKTFRVR